VEQTSTSKSQTGQSKNSSEFSADVPELVVVADDDTDPEFALRVLAGAVLSTQPDDEIPATLPEQRATSQAVVGPDEEPDDLVVGDDRRGESLEFRKMHPDVIAATARAGSVKGLLYVIGLTLALGIIGMVVLIALGRPADAVREVIQTAIAAEVVVLGSALAKPGS
jgi:hypothetical protein